jgi:ankyrin repeat protein
MSTTTTTIETTNLAIIASHMALTVQDIQSATKEQLEMDKTTKGHTALYWASKSYPVKIVAAILEKDVDVDAFSTGNETPLMVAANNIRWDTIRLLLQYGANAEPLNVVCCTFNISHPPIYLLYKYTEKILTPQLFDLLNVGGKKNY